MFLIIFSQQLAYLIVVVATGNAALPLISIIMLGITYGLQVSRILSRRTRLTVYLYFRL
jgi:chitin synthase